MEYKKCSSLLAKRVQDVELAENSNPIHGLDSAPLLSLEESLVYAKADQEFSTHNISFYVVAAMDFGRHRVQTNDMLLTVDEIACIHLYTQETPLYSILNSRLRSCDRQLLLPFLPFVKLFLTGLYKLPPLARMVYRGVKAMLSDQFKKGEKKTWWAFSSATCSLGVLENDMFVGKSGDRTMFHISTTHAFDISEFSAVPGENELLLAPHCELQVMDVLDCGHGLVMVQLQQLPYMPLLSYSFAPAKKDPCLGAIWTPATVGLSVGGGHGGMAASDLDTLVTAGLFPGNAEVDSVAIFLKDLSCLAHRLLPLWGSNHGAAAPIGWQMVWRTQCGLVSGRVHGNVAAGRTPFKILHLSPGEHLASASFAIGDELRPNWCVGYVELTTSNGNSLCVGHKPASPSALRTFPAASAKSASSALTTERVIFGFSGRVGELVDQISPLFFERLC